MQRIVRPRRLSGTLRVPGDKSISHRALICGALAQGTTTITNLAPGQDVQATRQALQRLGVLIEDRDGRVLVHGRGLQGLCPPSGPIDCMNAGTTMRLLMGLLAGQPWSSTLVGDESLSRRPMQRMATPLREMGGHIETTPQGTAPIRITGHVPLLPLSYALPVPSAQVKSGLLLAGLYAHGVTTLSGRLDSRDHTERMLAHFGVSLQRTDDTLSIEGGPSLTARAVDVPGDPSSAAFWIAAAALVPDSSVGIWNVNSNPTRQGFLNILQKMGFKSYLLAPGRGAYFEPSESMLVTSSTLRAISPDPEQTAEFIDEIPLLAVLATQAHGVTHLRGAAELRIKESDRIEAMATGLRAMGVTLDTHPDGWTIQGPQPLHGATIDPCGDHRIAMAFTVAGLIATGETFIQHPDCVAVSYPSFFQDLERIST